MRDGEDLYLESRIRQEISVSFGAVASTTNICRQVTTVAILQVTTIHTTFPSKNNQLCLTLELDIPEGSQNLSHPFVGEIINIIEPFRQTGRYSITIMRKKIGTQIGWFLTAKQLKQPKDLIEPIQHTINLQPVARHRISRRDESGDQQQTGRYSITKIRATFGAQVAWFLKAKQLLGPLRYSPTNRFQWNLQNLNLALTVGLQTN
ncbi:hypothetical protein L5515_003187 [Caenorhabditis briggsae]|uniref:Uncharacterized protein n=1 Tax=Caenorhabditis briggsae TaxID=6238 RepID=A0AAE9EIF9_CAEBR|nr:hypothetical protein L5515_003187 [Caenorhabditis briggsae]